jgi:hypothetical protein
MPTDPPTTVPTAFTDAAGGSDDDEDIKERYLSDPAKDNDSLHSVTRLAVNICRPNQTASWVRTS